MHDTACCFGYPSDSSRTARKRAGTLGWAGLRPFHATSSTRADATSATAPGPSCGRGRCSLCSLSPGRRRALPTSQWSWVSAGLPVGAPDRRHDRHGRPRKGRPWGGVRAGAAASGSPSVPFKGAAGPWSRAYHWHVCWAGVLRAPDRQQRAAASARASPGRAQSGYRPSEPPRARGPFKLGGHQAGP